MDRLKDKVVILSGGNSGIGACAAKLFAAEGAKVVISARRVEALDAVAEEIRQAGERFWLFPATFPSRSSAPPWWPRRWRPSAR